MRYFIFHPQDKYGIIALLIICTIIVFAPDVYYHFKVEEDFTAIQQKKLTLFTTWRQKSDSINAASAKTNNKNYKNNFYADRHYEATEVNAATSKIAKKTKKPLIKPLDVNTASASDFKLLKGIGPVFSERIVKYRDSKNGFNNIEELREVYGISDSLYTALLPRLTISKTKLLIDEKKYASKQKLTKTKREEPTKIEESVAKIDINTATAEELKTLKGIGQVLSKRIVKYRNSKSGFQNIEELNDVYGIADSLYFALTNRIEMSLLPKSIDTNTSYNKNIEANLQTLANTNYLSNMAEAVSQTFNNATEEHTKPKAKESTPLNININKATKEEWMQLKGIGEFRANAIVEHRSKLGGFYQLNQITEAYSINDSTYQNILPHLNLGTPTIKKININKVTFKTLLKHPYLDYNLTKHLINFRDKRKRLKNIEDLKKSYLIDAELYQKLSVYLTVD